MSGQQESNQYQCLYVYRGEEAIPAGCHEPPSISEGFSMAILVIFRLILLLLLIVLGSLVFSGGCRHAHAEEIEVGQRYKVEKKFFVAMKPTVIEDVAKAIRRRDVPEMTALIDSQEMGGLKIGLEFKLLFKATGRAASATAWGAEVYDGSRKVGTVYVFENYLDPKFPFVKKK